ncbi:hypothetical protein [Novosphingobium sp. FKTRR1]|uniref:hypothetical protein n=1 Tax=Novosphingobium sp. FKTRR1 TaxID=2879118 RepID=UPI001CEFBAED|nr:hypothetical protein [Novosphingobium sp. FKTRR1]
MNLHDVGAKTRHLFRWPDAGTLTVCATPVGARPMTRRHAGLSTQELRHLVAAMVD